jgi:hypothetical protein
MSRFTSGFTVYPEKCSVIFEGNKQGILRSYCQIGIVDKKKLLRDRKGSSCLWPVDRAPCGDPAISLHSYHVSLVQWTTRLLHVMRDPGSKPQGGY